MKKISLILCVVALFVSGHADAESVVSTSFNRNLMLGSSGKDVVDLQNFLISHNFLVLPKNATVGYFGGLTKVALIAYQKKSGIRPATGYFGPITKNKVLKDQPLLSEDELFNASRSITVLSPVGGEKWSQGSEQTIAFSVPALRLKQKSEGVLTSGSSHRVDKFDIYLIRDTPTCPSGNGAMCAYSNNTHVRYPISIDNYNFAVSTSSLAGVGVNSYQWKVGKFSTTTLVVFTDEAGNSASKYNSIEICFSGTDRCTKGGFFTVTQ